MKTIYEVVIRCSWGENVIHRDDSKAIAELFLERHKNSFDDIQEIFIRETTYKKY